MKQKKPTDGTIVFPGCLSHNRAKCKECEEETRHWNAHAGFNNEVLNSLGDIERAIARIQAYLRAEHPLGDNHAAMRQQKGAKP